jgi:hypothetical protein
LKIENHLESFSLPNKITPDQQRIPSMTHFRQILVAGILAGSAICAFAQPSLTFSDIVVMEGTPIPNPAPPTNSRFIPGVFNFTVDPELPPGLSLDHLNGVISGTPTNASPEAEYILNATLQPDKVCPPFGPCGTPLPLSASARFNITVFARPSLDYPPLPPMAVETAIKNLAPSFSGLPGPTFSATGSLPPGLSLNAQTGEISGTPSAAGSFNWTVKASFGALSATASLSVMVYAPSLAYPHVTLTPSSAGPIPIPSPGLAPLPTGFPEDHLPFTYTGSLPNGLSLNVQTGIISGTLRSAGTFNGTVTVTFGEISATATFSIRVLPPPSLSYPTLPLMAVGKAIKNLAPSFSELTGPSFSSTGSLPPGLSLNAQTGEISGTPSAAGSFNWTVKASFGALSATASLSVTVYAPTSLVPVDFTVKALFTRVEGVLHYGLPRQEHVQIGLISSGGRELVRFVDEVKGAGYHELPLPREALALGACVLVFQAGTFKSAQTLSGRR